MWRRRFQRLTAKAPSWSTFLKSMTDNLLRKCSAARYTTICVQKSLRLNYGRAVFSKTPDQCSIRRWNLLLEPGTGMNTLPIRLLSKRATTSHTTTRSTTAKTEANTSSGATMVHATATWMFPACSHSRWTSSSSVRQWLSMIASGSICRAFTGSLVMFTHSIELASSNLCTRYANKINLN